MGGGLEAAGALQGGPQGRLSPPPASFTSPGGVLSPGGLQVGQTVVGRKGDTALAWPGWDPSSRPWQLFREAGALSLCPPELTEFPTQSTHPGALGRPGAGDPTCPHARASLPVPHLHLSGPLRGPVAQHPLLGPEACLPAPSTLGLTAAKEAGAAALLPWGRCKHGAGRRGSAGVRHPQQVLGTLCSPARGQDTA